MDMIYLLKYSNPIRLKPSKKMMTLGWERAYSKRERTAFSLSPWYLLRISDGQTQRSFAFASVAAAYRRGNNQNNQSL
jgi:hypothetical protein